MTTTEPQTAESRDSNWPFGETDAMVWAEAFVSKSFTPDQIDTGLMVSWFANAMASADPKCLISRGNEEGQRLLGTMRDIDVAQMAQQCVFEIKLLRERIAMLEPKAHAYDNLTAVIRMAGPREGGSYTADIVRQLENQIAELTIKPERPERQGEDA